MYMYIHGSETSRRSWIQGGTIQEQLRCTQFGTELTLTTDCQSSFDMVPRRTVDVKGRKAVQVRTTGAEKGDLTAVFSCTANGDMLPPMIIFKGRSTKGPKSTLRCHHCTPRKGLEGWCRVWNKSCQFNQPRGRVPPNNGLLWQTTWRKTKSTLSLCQVVAHLFSNYNFVEKTFMDCSLLPCKRMPYPPKILRRNFRK